MFLHRPFGTFDLTGPAGRFVPAADGVLPCDAMIYLGTGFCRDGWNTGHGSFAFNPRVFPDPEAMVQALHDDGVRVVMHVVDPPLNLHGAVADGDGDADSAARYWDQHAPAGRVGIDGWWPDVGDMLDPAARLARIRMYWDGPVRDQPDRRPFALHRNAYAGVQRYGWIWSGDIDSAWRTLAMQVPVGLNVGLSGIPYWGTDTGGFITRREFTGELFVRWFQFSAFCPSFRSHGRTWKLRLPWGWNTGEYGPEEHDGRRTELPDPAELHNPAVEPICRQYLELRYRLLPYLYSAVRETAETGLPLMRALWLHYPDDPEAVRRGDLYLWGRDILVAPVVEKGATQRELYLPAGRWHDFWTGAVLEGGRSVRREVDLATLPLFVRAGAIVPTGPVRQRTDEASDEPVLLTVYPGADGAATLYEDDGTSFAHADGAWRKFLLTWHDASGRLEIALAPGSQPLAASRSFALRRAGSTPSTRLFDGTPLAVTL
jgi:alpha-glucosidase/alpha-D-xyloside xylohydrolase